MNKFGRRFRAELRGHTGPSGERESPANPCSRPLAKRDECPQAPTARHRSRWRDQPAAASRPLLSSPCLWDRAKIMCDLNVEVIMFSRSARWFLFAAPIALFSAGNASACYVPTQFRPAGQVFDAVLSVTVMNELGAGSSGAMQSRVNKVLRGQYREQAISLPWFVSDGKGSCPSSSPYLHKGDQASVYLMRSAQQSQAEGAPAFTIVGWMRSSDVR